MSLFEQATNFHSTTSELWYVSKLEIETSLQHVQRCF